MRDTSGPETTTSRCSSKNYRLSLREVLTSVSLKALAFLDVTSFLFFKHSRAVREQGDYLVYRDDRFARHLLQLHLRRPENVFSDILPRERPSIPCLFVYPNGTDGVVLSARPSIPCLFFVYWNGTIAVVVSARDEYCEDFLDDGIWIGKEEYRLASHGSFRVVSSLRVYL